MNWRKIFSIVPMFLIAQVALAHAVGTSYIAVEQNSDRMQTRVDLTLRDLEFGIGLDSNGDGQITWGEVLANSPIVTQYIEQHLSVSRGGERCALGSPDIAIDRHADEVYAAITLQTQCATSGAISVQSNLMFELDDSHRSLLTMKTDGSNTVTVLTAVARQWTETRTRFAAWDALMRFVGQGIWHIWIGFDHLAFLMLLLLPLARSANDVTTKATTYTIKQILKVVTAFTA
ncbi:MAG TPA: HupE/UreJ family protein, partial [Steroidobacteraceae bacterium]|nr:HupE/UreJ family protein [Steroidobacteraceae bacterium]